MIDSTYMYDLKVSGCFLQELHYNCTWIKKKEMETSEVIIYHKSHYLCFTVYNSFILSYICYCNIVWGNSSKMKIMLIYRLQKKALRLCTHSHYLAHTDPIFCKLKKQLKIADIHSFQTAIFMYKCWINTIPLAFRNIFVYNSDIHSHPTRHSSDFHLTNPKIIMAYKSIRHHGPDIWNALPGNIKHSATLYSFKASMKKYLISTYSKTS